MHNHCFQEIKMQRLIVNEVVVVVVVVVNVVVGGGNMVGIWLGVLQE